MSSYQRPSAKPLSLPTRRKSDAVRQLFVISRCLLWGCRYENATQEVIDDSSNTHLLILVDSTSIHQPKTEWPTSCKGEHVHGQNTTGKGQGRKRKSCPYQHLAGRRRQVSRSPSAILFRKRRWQDGMLHHSQRRRSLT